MSYHFVTRSCSGEEFTCPCRRHQVRSLGWKDPLPEEMTTHSSILAWEIPRTEEPGGWKSKWSQRVRHNWASENARILKMRGHSCFVHSLPWLMASYPKRIYFNPGRNIPVISFALCVCVFSIIFVSFLLFFGCSAACGTLVSWPGIEPIPPALEVWNCGPWTTGEVPALCCFSVVQVRFNMRHYLIL